MNTQRLVVALTLMNLALLIVALAQLHPALAQGTAPVLRAHALEIVDEQGRVREDVKPLGPQPAFARLHRGPVYRMIHRPWFFSVR